MPCVVLLQKVLRYTVREVVLPTLKISKRTLYRYTGDQKPGVRSQEPGSAPVASAGFSC